LNAAAGGKGFFQNFYKLKERINFAGVEIDVSIDGLSENCKPLWSQMMV